MRSRQMPFRSLPLTLSVSALGFCLVFLTIGRLPQVLAQSPIIASVTPSQTGVGQVPAKIVVKGSGFTTDSTVFFNTTKVTAKVKPSGTKIVIKGAPKELFQAGGIINVKVVSAGGAESNTVKLIVGSLNSINVIQPANPVVNTQGSVKIQAQLVDKDGKPISGATISFQSENPNLATVDSSGLVKGVNPGAATIVLTSSDTTKRVIFAVSQVIDSVPSGIFGDGDIKVDTSTGTVYATDLKNQIVKSGGLGKALQNFAGAQGVPGSTDGSLPDSRFNGPLGLGLGSQRILLADTANRAIRRFNLASGKVETIISLADVTASSGVTDWGPRGVVQNTDGDLFITDGKNHVVWQARFNGPQVNMNVLAGGLGQPGLKDELGTAARLNTPQEVDLNGRVLVVTDRGNKVVRLIGLPSGLVTTLGSSKPAIVDHPDDLTVSPNRDLTFKDPVGISFDPSGNIYVTDGDSVSVVTLMSDNTAVATDLAQDGTFQNAIGVNFANNAAFVLDSGKGQVIRIGLAPPTIAAVTPAQIQTGVGTEITVTGTNFLAETQVMVGSKPISGVTVDSSTKLRFQLSPQTQGGTLSVSISNRGGSAQSSLVVVGPPASPTNLVATPVSNSEIGLSWTDNSTNETGFVVERKIGPDGTFAPITTTGPNLTSFSNGALKAGTQYFFRVKATSEFGDSGFTNEATAVPATPVKISFASSPGKVAPGEKATVTINFDVSADSGEQPGTITLDLPFDSKIVNLAGVTVTAGTLIPSDTNTAYPAGDLVVVPFGEGIRVLLTSSKDPLNAKLNSGKGSFCTLSIPVLSSATDGSVPLNVSATRPFATQLNRPLVVGGQALPFTSTPGSITIAR